MFIQGHSYKFKNTKEYNAFREAVNLNRKISDLLGPKHFLVLETTDKGDVVKFQTFEGHVFEANAGAFVDCGMLLSKHELKHFNDITWFDSYVEAEVGLPPEPKEEPVQEPSQESPEDKKYLVMVDLVLVGVAGNIRDAEDLAQSYKEDNAKAVVEIYNRYSTAQVKVYFE